MYKVIKQLFIYSFLVIIIHSVCLSCTEPIDFDQAKDLELIPIVESSLIFFDEPANRFLQNGIPITTIQDFVEVQFFNTSFIVENLVKAEFVFETSNSINRAFQVQVDFLNQSDQIQHTFSFQATASANNTTLVSSFTEVFEGNSILALKNTSKLVFTINLLPGTPINQNTTGRINVKSKAILYFKIANNS